MRIAELLNDYVAVANAVLVGLETWALVGVVGGVAEGCAVAAEVESGSVLGVGFYGRFGGQGCVEDGVVRFHLGDGHTVDGGLFDPGVLLKECGILLDVEVGGDEAISVAGDTNEIGTTLVDLFQTGTDDASERNVFVGQSPAQINFRKRDPPITTERATPAEGRIISGKIFLIKCSRSFRRSRKVLEMKRRRSFVVAINAILQIGNQFLFYKVMLNRAIRRELDERLRAYPAVTLAGPRQCGKTTVARAFDGHYFDLEQQGDRLRLDLAWNEVISSERLVILDEAQEWPEVFPRLRGAIDDDRKRLGRFLLLGSVSPALMTQVSESLAGRLSLLELTPLLRSELPTSQAQAQHWLQGGYPDGGVLDTGGYPRWQLDYLSLLSQRDLPNWGLSAKPQTTDRLLRMLAALHAQAWNASQVGQSLGLSHHTVNTYLDYLVGVFLIRRLPSWQSNIRKRLTKAPKVYWRDSGLLHALHGVSNHDDLLNRPWAGASWEGYVIEQTIGELTTCGVHVTPWYFRTSDQYEIDLLLEFGKELWAVEIKLTSSPSTQDMSRLDKVADMVEATHRFLISQTTRPSDGERRASCNLATFLARLPGARDV